MSDRHFVHKHDEVQLARVLRESRPWLDQYGTTLIYGLAAVLAIAALVVYLARRPPASADTSRELLLASTSDDFMAVADAADEAGESKIAAQARLKQAEILLSTSIANLFSNREVGLTELKSAETAFELLAKRSDLPKDVRLRVLCGLARAAEARCDGTDKTVDAAVAAWKDVVALDGDMKMFTAHAEERLKKLPLESTRAFYAWFQKQDPKPQDNLNLPQDGPGAIPDIPGGFDIPSLPMMTPGDLAPSTPPPATPGSEPVTPATDTPAVVAPQGEAPATTPEQSTTPPTDAVPATPAEGTTTEFPAADAPVESTPANTPAADAPATDPAPSEPAAPPAGEAPPANPGE